MRDACTQGAPVRMGVGVRPGALKASSMERGGLEGLRRIDSRCRRTEEREGGREGGRKGRREGGREGGKEGGRVLASTSRDGTGPAATAAAAADAAATVAAAADAAATAPGGAVSQMRMEKMVVQA